MITFNSGHYQEISLSEWLTSNPTQLLATNFEISESLTERFPREERFIVSPSNTRR